MHCNLKNILTLVLLSIAGIASAQPDLTPEAPLQQQNVDTEEQLKTKLGVKFTLGMHTFMGNAFENRKPLYGFGAGIYNVVGLNKAKTFNLHWELNLTFKGSRFGTMNDTSYSKISIAYMELPVMASIQLLNTKKKLPLHLLVGFQAGVLFRSSVNKGYGKFGQVKTNLPFKYMDYIPVLGVRKEIGSGMSLQFCFKYGLRNIWTNKFYERSDPAFAPEDTNIDYRDLTPAFKDGTHSVRNLSFELSFMF